MRDWNNDGKIDSKDYAMDQYIFEETCKEEVNTYYNVLVIETMVVF